MDPMMQQIFNPTMGIDPTALGSAVYHNPDAAAGWFASMGITPESFMRTIAGGLTAGPKMAFDAFGIDRAHAGQPSSGGNPNTMMGGDMPQNVPYQNTPLPPMRPGSGGEAAAGAAPAQGGGDEAAKIVAALGGQTGKTTQGDAMNKTASALGALSAPKGLQPIMPSGSGPAVRAPTAMQGSPIAALIQQLTSQTQAGPAAALRLGQILGGK
jgi:hypothetical protein